MNWTKISAVAEIFSSIAIVVTLIYLAVQTQQNTAAIISNSRQQSLDADLELLRMMADYPLTAPDQPAVAGEDGIRQRAFDFSLFRIREHQWLQYRDGQLDGETWESYLKVLSQNLRTRDRLKLRWDELTATEGGLDSGFVAAINEELESAR